MPPKCDKCGEYMYNGDCKCSYHVGLAYTAWIFRIVCPGMKDLTQENIRALESEIGGEIYKNAYGWNMRCVSPCNNPRITPEIMEQQIIEILNR